MTSQARTLASKASDGRKNFLINTVAPFVNQEGDKTPIANNEYIADIWRLGSISTAVGNGAVNGDYRQFTVTTADASVAAGDLISFVDYVEGYDAAPLKLGTADAKTITISFKHKHTKVGTYCVALRNSAVDRSYVFEYSQSVSDAEETHSETIQLDTAGTWLTNNGVGLRVQFTVMCGTDRQTTADSWQAGNFLATSNQVNGVDAVSNVFAIADVQLEIGEVATDPEYIPYSEKLVQVQRYYWEDDNVYTMPPTNTDTASRRAPIFNPTPMRTIPTTTATFTSGTSPVYNLGEIGATSK